MGVLRQKINYAGMITTINIIIAPRKRPGCLEPSPCRKTAMLHAIIVIHGLGLPASIPDAGHELLTRSKLSVVRSERRCLFSISEVK